MFPLNPRWFMSLWCQYSGSLCVKKRIKGNPLPETEHRDWDRLGLVGSGCHQLPLFESLTGVFHDNNCYWTDKVLWVCKPQMSSLSGRPVPPLFTVHWFHARLPSVTPVFYMYLTSTLHITLFPISDLSCHNISFKCSYNFICEVFSCFSLKILRSHKYLSASWVKSLILGLHETIKFKSEWSTVHQLIIKTHWHCVVQGSKISGIASQFAIQNARFAIHNNLMRSKIANHLKKQFPPTFELRRRSPAKLVPGPLVWGLGRCCQSHVLSEPGTSGNC